MYLKESNLTPPVGIDWDGNQMKVNFRFILEVENNLITFGAQFPKECDALGKQGQFLEGLWEQSVVELFIHELESARYLEINLSPTGAYWCAEFSDYRVRKSELYLTPSIETKLNDGITTALMQIDIEDLINGKFELAQAAILKLGKGSFEEKIYLARKYAWGDSAKKALDCEPDFHQKKLVEVLSNYPPII